MCCSGALSSGSWCRIQAIRMAGLFRRFPGNSNKPADIRHEPDGTISATAGGGYNFHFYPYNRGQINPNDVGWDCSRAAGSVNPRRSERSRRPQLGSIFGWGGADYYPNLTGGWGWNSSFNPGVGNGKIKFVEIDWRSFAMTTCTLAQLQNNPASGGSQRSAALISGPWGSGLERSVASKFAQALRPAQPGRTRQVSWPPTPRSNTGRQSILRVQVPARCRSAWQLSRSGQRLRKERSRQGGGATRSSVRIPPSRWLT